MVIKLRHAAPYYWPYMSIDFNRLFKMDQPLSDLRRLCCLLRRLGNQFQSKIGKNKILTFYSQKGLWHRCTQQAATPISQESY